MAVFALEFLTRDSCAPSRDVTSVNAPGVEGRLTVLARHEPMTVLLKAGELIIRDAAGTAEHWRVGPGALRVRPGGATLLVQTAEREEQTQF